MHRGFVQGARDAADGTVVVGNPIDLHHLIGVFDALHNTECGNQSGQSRHPLAYTGNQRGVRDDDGLR
ncbi:hypothetical protein MGAD_45840 [Mycolicibacterium gadium]|uniref:Uncharacterized protein n=1 Tax=Mycolicibacterium gadium TaxID=1794 RepID=A0A7I7WRD6_MYCGU|nr:hypothetical protein MGAD_45840 [Mycolicibacterium gadium]